MKHKLTIRRTETYEAEVEVEAADRAAAIAQTDHLLETQGWDAVVDDDGEYEECVSEVVDDKTTERGTEGA